MTPAKKKIDRRRYNSQTAEIIVEWKGEKKEYEAMRWLRHRIYEKYFEEPRSTE